jgi:hypothetical protein
MDHVPSAVLNGHTGDTTHGTYSMHSAANWSKIYFIIISCTDQDTKIGRQVEG